MAHGDQERDPTRAEAVIATALPVMQSHAAQRDESLLFHVWLPPGRDTASVITTDFEPDPDSDFDHERVYPVLVYEGEPPAEPEYRLRGTEVALDVPCWGRGGFVHAADMLRLVTLRPDDEEEDSYEAIYFLSQPDEEETRLAMEQSESLLCHLVPSYAERREALEQVFALIGACRAVAEQEPEPFLEGIVHAIASMLMAATESSLGHYYIPGLTEAMHQGEETHQQPRDLCPDGWLRSHLLELHRALFDLCQASSGHFNRLVAIPAIATLYSALQQYYDLPEDAYDGTLLTED